MTNPLLFALLMSIIVFGGGFVIVLWLDRRAARGPTKKQALWEQEQRARDKARCEEIEEGLMEWLKMLELPQLEDKERLEAVARDLRILFVDAGLRGQRVR